MTRIDALKERYPTLTSQKDKAEAEADIWNAVPTHERSSGGIGGHLSKVLGTSVYEISLRHSVWRAGSAADPVWERLDGEMTLSTARTVLKKARARARTEGTLRNAILREMEDYDRSDGNKLGSGKTSRRAYQERDGESRKFWSSLRTTVTDWFKSTLREDVPKTETDRLVKEFLVDVDIVFRDHQLRLGRTAAQQEEKKKVGRKAVLSACQTLGVDPPGVGKRPDMIQAKKKMRSLGREYHPDRNPGDPNVSNLFHEVMEAWETIQAYDGNLAERN